MNLCYSIKYTFFCVFLFSILVLEKNVKWGYSVLLTVTLKSTIFSTFGMTRILACWGDNWITFDSWLKLLSRNVTALELQHQVCIFFCDSSILLHTWKNREIGGLSVLLTVTLKSTILSTFGMTRILASFGDNWTTCDSWSGNVTEPGTLFKSLMIWVAGFLGFIIFSQLWVPFFTQPRAMPSAREKKIAIKGQTITLRYQLNE